MSTQLHPALASWCRAYVRRRGGRLEERVGGCMLTGPGQVQLLCLQSAQDLACLASPIYACSHPRAPLYL